MSDYSCHEHGYDFHKDCSSCEAANDFSSQNRRIAKLEDDLAAWMESRRAADVLLRRQKKENVRLNKENAELKAYVRLHDNLDWDLAHKAALQESEE